jgi:hypothetical protein
MNPRKEYALIFLIFFCIPILAYVGIKSFLYAKNNSTEEIVQKVEQVLTVKSDPTSLLFVGDIMLDRTIRKDGELYGYTNLFSCLKEEQ